MRISISTLILAAGLTSGVASTEPSSTPVLSTPVQSSSSVSSSTHHQSDAPNLSLLEQNRLTVELLPPTCNLNACLGLTGTISCIVSALQAGDLAALSTCLNKGLQGICSCAACVPAVIHLLNSLGVCTNGPTGNTTVTPSMDFNTFVTSTAGSRTGGVDTEVDAAPTNPM